MFLRSRSVLSSTVVVRPTTQPSLSLLSIHPFPSTITSPAPSITTHAPRRPELWCLADRCDDGHAVVHVGGGVAVRLRRPRRRQWHGPAADQCGTPSTPPRGGGRRRLRRVLRVQRRAGEPVRVAVPAVAGVQASGADAAAAAPAEARHGAADRRRHARPEGRLQRAAADEGEVLEAPARGGHVRGRQGGLHRRRHLQRDHQPLRDRLRELPQAGAAAGREAVHVAAGDGLPALRLRLHRRVLPVQGHPARRHRPRSHGHQTETRHLRQPPRPREARRHAARDPGRVSEDRILVPERQGAQGQQRRLGALPSGEPPRRGAVVAARAVRHQARAHRVGTEGPAAEARLREPDPQGGHGHQQRHSRRDKDSRVLHADASQVRAGERGRRDLPANVVPGQVRAGVPAGLPGDLVGARGPGGRRPRGGCDARVAAEGQPRPLEVAVERRQGPHGVGQERDAGKQGTGRPALPQAALPRPLPDHPRRKQDTAQQGRWASHPGELLQGAGEPGIHHSNMYRRCSFRRRVRDEDLIRSFVHPAWTKIRVHTYPSSNLYIMP